ncbi:hypothetical protein BO71DRAFT_416677 [Aspergillus ellipticus CBS 707.79]|uniref:Protein kinase domain-containing protein n=1 Tax=Aspergillus ellipticus CBS 707.79 TaxID=1448320 RepID=A0A319DMF7_9EURO|nr:hypothetical protein BO71DRAFT_416677 [Aspergillus ellipticus CBS 707.79]
MSDESWTEKFFFRWPLPDWIHEIQRKWILGRSVRTSLRSSQDQIQVLWLFVQYQETYVPKFVAKVFPDYTENDAQIQLRRFPSRIPKKLKEVKDELDSYINEARAYHRIEKSCTSSERIYFPEFHSIITDLGISKFTSGYTNPRAIVLEPIRPKLASRRILSAHGDHTCKLQNQLNILGSLSVFEMEYYHSLFYDRIRRLLALHRLGITHGDVRDDHFRLPEDFYNTVLYNFSHSYTFSPVTPYLVNFRPPYSLKDISDSEQAMVKQQMYSRAEKLDYRAYLIKSTGVAQPAIMDILFQPLKDEALELIILRVNFRPDS